MIGLERESSVIVVSQDQKPRHRAWDSPHSEHTPQKASLSRLFRHDHPSRTILVQIPGHWPMRRTSVANSMLLPLKSSNVRGKFCSCCLLSSGLLARVWCSMSSVKIPIVSMKACLGPCVEDHTFSSRSDQSFSTSMKFCSGPLDLMRP